MGGGTGPASWLEEQQHFVATFFIYPIKINVVKKKK